MKLIVDQSQRKAKMRAHTATHILHAVIGEILSATKQAGSLVDEDYVRFDFHTQQALTTEQLSHLEERVNAIIAAWLPVSMQEMSFDEAKKLWAKAFFADKYGERVRVVMIGDENNERMISLELCGGTHVTNTDEIGWCALVAQESVASWIKRITAVTGTRVVQDRRDHLTRLDTIAQTLGVQSKQIEQKLEKERAEKEWLADQLESMQTSLVHMILDGVSSSSHDQIDSILQVNNGTYLSTIPWKSLVHIVNQYAWQKKNTIMVIHEQWSYALCVYSDDWSAKKMVQERWIKGWWSDRLVQWKDWWIRQSLWLSE